MFCIYVSFDLIVRLKKGVLPIFLSTAKKLVIPYENEYVVLSRRAPKQLAVKSETSLKTLSINSIIHRGNKAQSNADNLMGNK